MRLPDASQGGFLGEATILHSKLYTTAFATDLIEQYVEGNLSHFQEELRAIARVIIGKALNR